MVKVPSFLHQKNVLVAGDLIRYRYATVARFSSHRKINTCHSKRGSLLRLFQNATAKDRVEFVVIMVESDVSFTSVPESKAPPSWIFAEVKHRQGIPRPTYELSHTSKKKHHWGTRPFQSISVYIVFLALVCAWGFLTLAGLNEKQATFASHEDGAYTVSEVLTKMQTNLHNSVVQTRGCIVLWALKESGAGGDSWNPEQHSVIFEAMERYRYNPRLQQQCLRAIGGLVSIERRCDEGLVSAVLKIMQDYESDFEIQNQAMAILRRMPQSSLHRSKSAIAPLVLNFLHRFGRSKRILEEGIHLLMDLVTTEKLDARADDDSVIGFIATLISACLDYHIGSATSCHDFGSFDFPAIEAIVLTALDLLLQTVSQNHDESISVSNYCLIAKGETCTRIIDPVWRVMIKYDNGAMLRKALQALTSFAEIGKEIYNFQQCLERKNEDVVLEKMSQNVSDEMVQMHGLRLLRFFPTIYPQQKLISVLTQAIRSHLTNKDIVQPSLSLLAAMDSSQSLSHSEMEVIVKLLWRFSTEEEIVASCCRILLQYVEFSQLPKTIVVLESLHALSHSKAMTVDNETRAARAATYLSLMLHFPFNEAIQEACVRCLAQLAGPIHPNTALFDAVRGAYRAYGKHNAIIRQHALNILGSTVGLS